MTSIFSNVHKSRQNHHQKETGKGSGTEFPSWASDIHQTNSTDSLCVYWFTHWNASVAVQHAF